MVMVVSQVPSDPVRYEPDGDDDEPDCGDDGDDDDDGDDGGDDGGDEERRGQSPDQHTSACARTARCAHSVTSSGRL